MDSIDKKSFYIELGKKIRETREEKELTQEELASLLSITRTSVTNIEKGRQKMFLHTYLEIAQALRVSPEKITPSLKSSITLADTLKDKLQDRELSWVQEAIKVVNDSKSN